MAFVICGHLIVSQNEEEGYSVATPMLRFTAAKL